jgi:uncharacterized protein (DUF305 family)
MKINKLLARLAVLAVLLVGCAGGTGHNDADVAFAQGMIPHHRQAVAMAELAGGRTENPAVLDLAARIEAAQAPEIDTLTAWLQEWDVEVPAGDMAGMDHGDMSGMGSPEDLAALEAALGAGFDRLFLEQMTVHHEGAVQMAQTELADGADPDVLALARTVAESQQAEIDEMAALLTPA